MSAEGLRVLIEAAVALSAAVLLIGALRKPLRRLAGAGVAYGLWLLVPVVLAAALIPADSPAPPVLRSAGSLTYGASHAVARLGVLIQAPTSGVTTMALWTLGALASLGWLLHRQAAFVRSLEPLTAARDGTFSSSAVAAPMLVGLLRPRIVVPNDFERRYSASQRELMLVHERTHLEQRDPLINALAAGVRCVFWFNPLAHLAAQWLCIDQELACDARVLGFSGVSRRLYAETLVQSQLETESFRHPPAGCAWQSHPLKERVTMLKHPLPGTGRRLVGNLAIATLTLASGYAVWAEAPATTAPDGARTRMEVTMKWQINGRDVLIPGGASVAHIRAVSGHEFVKAVSFASGQVEETRCTPWLPSETAASVSATFNAVRAAGQSTDHMILLQCQLLSNGKLFAKPAILVGEGKPGAIEATDAASHKVFRLEMTASSSNRT